MLLFIKLYYYNTYVDMTLEPERDNANDIRTKLAQHVQVAQKMAALSSDWSAPHRTQNRIFCVERSSSEETPNTPKLYGSAGGAVNGAAATNAVAKVTSTDKDCDVTYGLSGLSTSDTSL